MNMYYNDRKNCRDISRKTVKLFLLLFISFSFGLVHAEEHDKRNHLSVFLGGTHVLNEDLNGETLGLDY